MVPFIKTNKSQLKFIKYLFFALIPLERNFMFSHDIRKLVREVE